MENREMGLKGFFKADREEYHLSEPILVTLVIKNETDHEIYLFVPRGRADGIRITVKEGKNFQIKGMREEPEVGLVPEERLLSGEIYRRILQCEYIAKEFGQSSYKSRNFYRYPL
ncbi:MAG: hypothetical protein O8C59_05965 [Candidatus Methanoperedens sp.]|nr:hypothetical protein [Candidatus Methanoperedens sp.]